MAAKKNKAKKLSNDKGFDIWDWYDLPPEISQLLRSKKRTRRSPVHFVSNTCTAKSWIPATSRCSRSGECRLPQLHLLGNSSNTSSATTRQKYFTLNYMIQNAAADCRQIMVYCTDERLRIRYECTTRDPFDAKKRRMEFTSIIGIEGKFYALSLQGALAVVENMDSGLTIAEISRSRAVPSVSSRFFKEYLIEMNGEIFLVFIIHQKSLEIVDKVEVFRHCFVKLKWVKIKRLQGKTLFLDQRCSWVNSGDIGCKGDCIYFTQGSGNGWWIYDMENWCISPAASLEN